jgi:competence protein ComEA
MRRRSNCANVRRARPRAVRGHPKFARGQAPAVEVRGIVRARVGPRFALRGAMKSHLLALYARARSSTWAPIAVRCVGVFVVLLVLAWIGRSATAMATAASIAPASSSTSTTSVAADAGAPATPPIEAATGVVAPAVTPAAASPPPVAFSPASRGRASPEEPVYLNYASADELRRLPGCGPKRADAILAMRQRMGKFQRVEDLLRIKGIGRAAVRKWRPLVRLDAPAPPPPASAGDAGPTSS